MSHRASIGHSAMINIPNIKEISPLKNIHFQFSNRFMKEEIIRNNPATKKNAASKMVMPAALATGLKMQMPPITMYKIPSKKDKETPVHFLA